MDDKRGRTWTQWAPLGIYWALLFSISLTHRAATDDLLMPLLILAGLPFFVVASRALAQPLPVQYDDSLAFKDELTSLRNRRAFTQDVQRALHRAKPGTVGLILLDVDGLKRLNDECGHQAGDELLASVAFHLTGKGGTLYRIGGDEFAVLIERSKGDNLTRVLSEMQPYMAKFAACGHRHEVRMSFGSTSNHGGESFDSLFRRADERLRHNKRQLYRRGERVDRRIAEPAIGDVRRAAGSFVTAPGPAGAGTPSVDADPGPDDDGSRPHLRLLG